MSRAAKDADRGSDDLLIGDLANHLSRWASVERNERMGSPSLSTALTLLVDCLKKHRSRPLTDLSELRLEHRDRRTREVRKPAAQLPDHLDVLEWDEVLAILDNEQYLKKQLIEMGERRLGIPRSRLSRLKRADAIAAIRAALDNERSLVSIERHAQLAGERRTA